MTIHPSVLKQSGGSRLLPFVLIAACLTGCRADKNRPAQDKKAIPPVPSSSIRAEQQPRSCSIDQLHWSTEQVAETLGQYRVIPALTMDKAGHAHISYSMDSRGPNRSVLMYATNASGLWATTVVDSKGSVGEHNAIVVADDGKVHISYWDRTHNALKHATGTGNSWKTSSVDTAGNVGFFTSIAAGKNGSLSISYHSETQHSLKVASLAGEEWKLATVDNNGMPGFGTSIAFAQDGGLWLAEVNLKQKALSCFVRAGDGSWREMKLSSEGDFSAPDLKMGPSDQAHIAYHDKQGLFVASLSNGTWNKEPIALGPRIGAARIAVAPNGAIHTSFMDFSAGVLKYANNSSGQWQSGDVVVSKDGAGPGAIAIAIGPNGTVQIAYSYEDHGKKSLRFATGSCEANAPAK